jgi:hypothetical protein
MNLRLLIPLLAISCLSAQAQKFNVNTINCKLSKDNWAYLNKIGQFEAKFYNVVFNTTANDTLPIQINLYGKLAEYNQVQKEAMNTTFIDGFYSPAANRVFVYKSDRFMEILLHESSHNMLQNNMRNSPEWLNEGIATLFGYLIVQNNDIYYNKQQWLIKIVKDQIFTGKFNLSGFFKYRQADWYDKDARDYLYGVSYCLVYFFVKDDIENLQNVLLLMKQHYTTQAALAKVFGTFERFEKRFTDFYKPEVGYRL